MDAKDLIKEKFQETREKDIFYPEDLKEGGQGSDRYAKGSSQGGSSGAELSPSDMKTKFGLSSAPSQWSSKEKAVSAVADNMRTAAKYRGSKTKVGAMDAFEYGGRHYTAGRPDAAKMVKNGAKLHSVAGQFIK